MPSLLDVRNITILVDQLANPVLILDWMRAVGCAAQERCKEVVSPCAEAVGAIIVKRQSALAAGKTDEAVCGDLPPVL